MRRIDSEGCGDNTRAGIEPGIAGGCRRYLKRYQRWKKGLMEVFVIEEVELSCSRRILYDHAREHSLTSAILELAENVKPHAISESGFWPNIGVSSYSASADLHHHFEIYAASMKICVFLQA